jgi:hypothetical protein
MRLGKIQGPLHTATSINRVELRAGNLAQHSVGGDGGDFGKVVEALKS